MEKDKEISPRERTNPFIISKYMKDKLSHSVTYFSQGLHIIEIFFHSLQNKLQKNNNQSFFFLFQLLLHE